MVEYVITLPQGTPFMFAHANETRIYTLENIELEYETITNHDMAADISSSYSTDRSLSYEHVTLMRKEEWDKSSTIQKMNVNISRKSMRAIVLLFKSKIDDDD